MKRILEPEWLDQLSAEDPSAQRSRGDLCRINAWMGNAKILAREMRAITGASNLRRVLDLGAGDGQFMAQVAACLAGSWNGTHLDLLDRQATLSPNASCCFRKCGWTVR